MSYDQERFILNDDQYFTAVHPAIIADLNDFSFSVNLLMRGSHYQPDADSVISAANRLVKRAYAIFRQPESARVENTMAGFTDGIRLLMDFFNGIPDSLATNCCLGLSVHFEYFKSCGLDPTDAALFPPSYALDFIVNCMAVMSGSLFSHYRWRSEDPRRVTSFFDTASAERAASDTARTLIRRLPEELPGWCSNDKALMLYSLVRETKPKVAVEIGIFGGRSIVPIALGLKDNAAGNVIGIETWSATISTKYRTNVGNDFSWSVTNYAEIKRAFLRYILAAGLDDVISIVQASSERAHLLLDTIDFIHIDGGHSSFGSVQDITNYLPKVRKGGIVIFDDIDWSSTASAVEVLLDTCQLLHVVESMGSAGVPGCAAFMKL